MKRNITRLAGIFMAFAFIIAVGCSSSTAGDKDESVLSRKTHTIEIRQMKFIPDLITVAEGDKIVFVNYDMVMHDITEVSKKWSHQLPVNESWIYTADKSTEYYCSLHPVMKGKIVVE